MKEKIHQLLSLIEEGYTSSRACEKLDLNPKSVHYYYHKYNIFPKNKFSKYNIKCDYFDIIDTEKKSYFLGLLLADGCIIIENKTEKDSKYKNSNSYRIALSLQQEDDYVIDEFSKELGFEKEKKINNNQNGVKLRKPQRRFRFNSKYMVDTLMSKYNILPRKTLDSTFKFPFETIPEELQRHFIRGFFDGDGSVSFNLTKKSFLFNFSFVFTSESFALQCANIFETLFNIKPVIYQHIGKTTN